MPISRAKKNKGVVMFDLKVPLREMGKIKKEERNRDYSSDSLAKNAHHGF